MPHRSRPAWTAAAPTLPRAGRGWPCKSQNQAAGRPTTLHCRQQHSNYRQRRKDAVDSQKLVHLQRECHANIEATVRIYHRLCCCMMLLGSILSETVSSRPAQQKSCLRIRLADGRNIIPPQRLLERGVAELQSCRVADSPRTGRGMSEHLGSKAGSWMSGRVKFHLCRSLKHASFFY